MGDDRYVEHLRHYSEYLRRCQTIGREPMHPGEWEAKWLEFWSPGLWSERREELKRELLI